MELIKTLSNTNLSKNNTTKDMYSEVANNHVWNAKILISLWKFMNICRAT